MGLAGGLEGLALGCAASWVLQLFVNRYASSLGLEPGFAVFDFPPWLLLGAVGFALFLSVLSRVYPSSRAARTDPIEALRAE